MVAYGVSVVEQITFLLGRHDPGDIFAENPDAPPNEYESEAEDIIALLTSSGVTQKEVEAVVSRVVRESFSDVRLSRRRVKRIARDIVQVLA